jgi:hypothetical protein
MPADAGQTLNLVGADLVGRGPAGRSGVPSSESARGTLRRDRCLRGQREEFQRDIVRITEGQARTIIGIDDTAIDDAELV